MNHPSNSKARVAFARDDTREYCSRNRTDISWHIKEKMMAKPQNIRSIDPEKQLAQIKFRKKEIEWAVKIKATGLSVHGPGMSDLFYNSVNFSILAENLPLRNPSFWTQQNRESANVLSRVYTRYNEVSGMQTPDALCDLTVQRWVSVVLDAKTQDGKEFTTNQSS